MDSVGIAGNTYVFERTEFFPGAQPQVKRVAVRPLLIHNENQNPFILVGALAVKFKQRILRELERTTINPQYTRGKLLMTDIAGDGDHQSALARNIGPNQINGELLFELFDKASGQLSNPDINVFTVLWEYFPEPVGGAKPILAGNVKGIDEKSKKIYSYNDEPMNCGIIAFVIGCAMKGIFELKRITDLSPTRREYLHDCYTSISDLIDGDVFISIPKLGRVVNITGFTFTISCFS